MPRPTLIDLTGTYRNMGSDDRIFAPAIADGKQGYARDLLHKNRMSIVEALQMRVTYASAVLALLLPMAGRAQRRAIDPSEHSRFAKNEAQLQASITTDRKVYFPGERFTIELSVVNPTPGTLEVRGLVPIFDTTS